MKKLLSAASLLLLPLLALVALRASAPALAAQDGAQGLEGRVAALEEQLKAEQKRHDETRALLEQTLQYLEKQSKGAEALLVTLDEVEQQGFAVGENWRSRETLLTGFRRFWGEAKSGLPKAPAPPPAQPQAPVRPARR